MVIDAHHHFWRYTPAEYGWIDDGMAMLRRDFLPDDLRRETEAAGVDSVISVQARQTLEETRWLLQIAREQPSLVRGVVGWVPLADPGIVGVLEELIASPQLRGVRHVVQAEPDDQFLLRADFNRGVDTVHRLGLCYDLLIFERHLPVAAQFVDRHPSGVFVLDHIAKPKIKVGELQPWRKNLIELARRRNVYCKISGLVTEADWNQWTPASLRPYVDTVLEAFGPERCMFGSDWPVCLVASGYSHWLATVKNWIAPLSADEQAAILGETAATAYGLEGR